MSDLERFAAGCALLLAIAAGSLGFASVDDALIGIVDRHGWTIIRRA